METSCLWYLVFSVLAGCYTGNQMGWQCFLTYPLFRPSPLLQKYTEKRNIPYLFNLFWSITKFLWIISSKMCILCTHCSVIHTHRNAILPSHDLKKHPFVFHGMTPRMHVVNYLYISEVFVVGCVMRWNILKCWWLLPFFEKLFLYISICYFKYI